MGRSVSYARGSVARVYYDVSHHGHEQQEDGTFADDYNDAIAQWDWEDFKEGLVHEIETLWPSFKPCDEWLDREDLAFMENDLAYIGLSEYCGCACLWLVPKESDGYYPEDIKLDNLAKGFCSRISDKFMKKFGEFVRVGGFSNGESVYERKAG